MVCVCHIDNVMLTPVLMRACFDDQIISSNAGLASHYDNNDPSRCAVVWGVRAAEHVDPDQIEYWFVLPNAGRRGVAIRLRHGTVRRPKSFFCAYRSSDFATLNNCGTVLR